MTILSIILIIIAIPVTFFSCVSRKRQREELLKSSVDLYKNFTLLLSKIEEKINEKEINHISGKKSVTNFSEDCSKLVINLVTREMKAHAIADIAIRHKHENAFIYLASPFEEKRYIVKGKSYRMASRDELSEEERKVIEVL